MNAFILGLCNVLNQSSVWLNLQANVEVGLEHGHIYFATVTAINSAGLSATSSSNGIIIDTSPPIVQGFSIISPIIIDENTTSGSITSEIIAVSTNKWKISASWNYVIDLESEIKRIVVCATTIEEECNLLLWRDLSPNSLFFDLDFQKSLQSGTIFMLKLQVENGAALKTIVISDRVLVDYTPPIKGLVKINGEENLVLLQQGQRLVASWQDFQDFETGIKEYQWKICFAINISYCVTEFVSIGLKNKIALSDTGNDHAKEYKFVVKAVNFAGLETTAVSNSFIFDSTSPETGIVLNGVDPFEDIRYQSSSTQIFAYWKGFQDKETRISFFEICIGSIAGLCDVAEFKNIGLANSTIVSNLNITHNATYFTTVRATNGAGQTAFASSNGITLDLTPPIGGKLRDGDDLDIDLSIQDLFVSMNWDEFNDPESGISKYVVCAGTIMGACDLVSATTVNGLEVKLNVWPAISSGTVVYSTLWAYSNAGGVTEIYSDGVLVDSTPPTPGTVSI